MYVPCYLACPTFNRNGSPSSGMQVVGLASPNHYNFGKTSAPTALQHAARPLITAYCRITTASGAKHTPIVKFSSLGSMYGRTSTYQVQ
jgi:hypothetical protein